MVEKQSEIGRDAQLAMLLRHKWQIEIEKAVDSGWLVRVWDSDEEG